MEIKLDCSAFDVDLERTRTYHSSNTLCPCVYCRYYRENIQQQYPKLAELLTQFGANATRPDETEPEVQKGTIGYSAHYTVSGTIPNGGRSEITLRDTEDLKLVFEQRRNPEKESCPSEQKGPWFVITVRGLCLPCAWAAAPMRRSIFFRLFPSFRSRKRELSARAVPPLPDEATLVEEMYNQDLNYPTCGTILIFYSSDRKERAVVLRREDSLYTYQLERLWIDSEEEWSYTCRGVKHPKPAMWEPFGNSGVSLFGTEAEALRELRADPRTQDWAFSAN